MKIILACLISLITLPVMGQWRSVKISSFTDTAAITENFRRASLWSNRKLDRFGNDTVYGQPIFQNGIKFLDGTIQTTAVVSTGSFATTSQLTSTASALTALTSVVAGKLTSPATFYIVNNTDYLTNPATFQILLPSQVIPSTATGYYGIYVASAGYAANGGSGSGSVSTVTIDALPIGSIIAYSTTTPPQSYLYCDGSSKDRTAYAALFAVSTCTYGCASPTTFNVPNLKGMFLRGLDTTGTIDSEARVIGSSETDKFQGHYHSVLRPTSAAGSNVYFVSQTVAATNGTWDSGNPIGMGTSPVTDGTNGTPRTGNETRPKNIAVAYMIKYEVAPVALGNVGFKEQISTSAWNGTGNTLTLTNTPLPNSLSVSKNGVTLASIFDYTLSGVTITFNTAPASSTTIRAYYAIADSSTSIYTATGTWTGAQILSSATINALNMMGDIRSNSTAISVSSRPLAYITLATGNTLRVINTLPAIVTYGEPVLVTWRFVCRPSGGDAYLHIELVRNGSTQITPQGARGILATNGWDTNISGTFIDTPTAGSNTYSLQGYGDNNIAVICSGGGTESWAQFSATRLH